MPVIISGINRSAIDGASALYIGPNRVEVQAADGEVLIPGPVSTGTAPTVSTVPVISGGSEVGDVISGAAATFLGTAPISVTHTWYLGATLLNNEDATSIDTSEYGAGTYTRHDTGSNAYGSIVAVSNAVEIEESATTPTGIDYATTALGYFDADTPYTGTTTDVTEFTAEGTGGMAFPFSGAGTIEHNDGFRFNGGRYLRGSTNLPAAATADGIMMAIEFTRNAIVGTDWAKLMESNGSGFRAQINPSGNLIITASDDTNVNSPQFPYTDGTRTIFVVAMDDVTDTFYGIGPDGNPFGPIAHPGLTDPDNNRIDFGRSLDGTIHRWALFGRPEGGEFPYSVEEVFADFQAGV